MDRKFIVRHGDRAFVLYAGLLAEAHAKGLQSIVTAIQQIPAAENGQVAVVTAAVTVEDAAHTKLYTGTGDADPSNVRPRMVTCLLRLAETRAKARALRDAINVNMCNLEELDGADESEQFGDTGPQCGQL